MFRQASEHCQFRRRRFHPANIGDDMFSEAGATNPINAIVTGDGHSGLNPHFTQSTRFLEVDEATFEYLTHPRLVFMAEELVGAISRWASNKEVPEWRVFWSAGCSSR